jgi:hypothetical protein
MTSLIFFDVAFFSTGTVTHSSAPRRFGILFLF